MNVQLFDPNDFEPTSNWFHRSAYYLLDNWQKEAILAIRRKLSEPHSEAFAKELKARILQVTRLTASAKICGGVARVGEFLEMRIVNPITLLYPHKKGLKKGYFGYEHIASLAIYPLLLELGETWKSRHHRKYFDTQCDQIVRWNNRNTSRIEEIFCTEEGRDLFHTKVGNIARSLETREFTVPGLANSVLLFTREAGLSNPFVDVDHNSMYVEYESDIYVEGGMYNVFMATIGYFYLYGKYTNFTTVFEDQLSQISKFYFLNSSVTA